MIKNVCDIQITSHTFDREVERKVISLLEKEGYVCRYQFHDTYGIFKEVKDGKKDS